jgi:hypothetical protein
MPSPCMPGAGRERSQVAETKLVLWHPNRPLTTYEFLQFVALTQIWFSFLNILKK